MIATPYASTIAVLVTCTMLISCSGSTVVPQESFSVALNGVRIEVVIDSLKTHLATAGYRTESTTLDKTENIKMTDRNSGSVYFEDGDGSTVSITNLLYPECADVSIYSTDGVTSAATIANGLRHRLSSEIPQLGILDFGACRDRN